MADPCEEDRIELGNVLPGELCEVVCVVEPGRPLVAKEGDEHLWREGEVMQAGGSRCALLLCPLHVGLG